jgi:hypothetical protein
MTAPETTYPRRRRTRDRLGAAAVVVLAAAVGVVAAALGSPRAWERPSAGTTGTTTVQQGSP